MANQVNANRLFLASCVALIVTAMTFAIRAGILTQLGTDFELTNTQLGWVNSMAFLGFPIATIFGGFLYNLLGAKKLMWLAFASHLLGLLLTIFAGGFWTLLISTFFIGFANGTVEAACNPMIADMYHDNKTTMLNRFHVWFPGGIVIGALCAYLMTNAGIGWQPQIAIMLIPTAIYAFLIFGQEFPESEHMETSTAVNFSALLNPIYLVLIAAMTLTATTELGTQQWVEKILGQTGAHPMLILILVTGLMAVGRFFAGPVVHRLNPIGVLFGSSIIAAIGIYLMSMATGPMVYLAAILFAIGVMYFWPTMIGSVAEYTPKTGALGLSLLGGAGMFATSIWQPIIGNWLDTEKAKAIAEGMAPEAAELAAGQATLGKESPKAPVLGVYSATEPI
ncbi:MAG: MFS transporter, partial [Bacteroidota bacterium]